MSVKFTAQAMLMLEIPQIIDLRDFLFPLSFSKTHLPPFLDSPKFHRAELVSPKIIHPKLKTWQKYLLNFFLIREKRSQAEEKNYHQQLK